jgi:hypothetical protein
MYCQKHFIYREAKLYISKFQLLTKTINLKTNLDYLLYEIKNFICDLTCVSISACNTSLILQWSAQIYSKSSHTKLHHSKNSKVAPHANHRIQTSSISQLRLKKNHPRALITNTLWASKITKEMYQIIEPKHSKVA